MKARVSCVWSCLFLGVVGVAPPAVLPPPVRSAALPATASVAQPPGAAAAVAGSTVAGPSAASAAFEAFEAQTAARLRGLPPTMSQTTNEESTMTAHFNHPQVSQPSYAPTASGTSWGSSLGSIVLATVAGALAGLLWQRRALVMKSKEVKTEMTVCSSTVLSEQPKFAAAVLASEELFDPAGLVEDSGKAKEINHGQVALLASLRRVSTSPASQAASAFCGAGANAACRGLVGRNGWRLDMMEVGLGGIGQLVVHEGYYIGEQAMFEILSKNGYRYRMRATSEEQAKGIDVPPITQIGPVKLRLFEMLGGSCRKTGLKRPEGYRGIAGAAAWDTDLPTKNTQILGDGS